MKDNRIQSILGLSTQLNFDYKILEKIVNRKKTPSPIAEYSLLKKMDVEETTIDQFFRATYGSGNSAYLTMMREKLEGDYIREC